MNSSAEIKKPPLAPKPKFVIAHKPAPPPIAPKPDVMISSGVQSTKKTKPAIAPKPKVFKDSPTSDIQLTPARKSTVNFPEHSKELLENLENLNCKNGIPGEDVNATYIFCSCTSECTHKTGTGENVCRAQVVLEHLEKLESLESIKIGEQATKTVRTRRKLDPNREKVTPSHVFVKASLLEGKPRDVSTHVAPVGCHLKQRSGDGTEEDDNLNPNEQVRIDFYDLITSPLNFDEDSEKQNHYSKLVRDEGQGLGTCQDWTRDGRRCFCSLDRGAKENGKMNSLKFQGRIRGKAEEDKDVSFLVMPSLRCAKKLPVPKPRKLRPACLVRQEGVDDPDPRDADNLVDDSFSFAEHCMKKANQSDVPDQNILYHSPHGEEGNQANHHSGDEGSQIQTSLEKHDFTPYQKCPKPPYPVEKMEFSGVTDCNPRLESKTLDGSSMLPVVDTLSLSLHKQRLTTNSQHVLPAISSDVPAQKMDKEGHVRVVSSPKVAPKKPQRHSLPAAGLLKKAASEELVDKSSYPSNEETCLRPLSTKDMPKRASEKPVWKLPHPILPFSGSPESLKAVGMPSASQSLTSLMKPRAKSMSSVDIERTEKPCKNSQKKNTLKRLLNMKLSLCIMKSDLQKLLAKGSQSVDVAPGNLLCGEGKRVHNDQPGPTLVNEKKIKPVKAYSADTDCPALKMKSQRPLEVPNGQRAESLDDQMLSRETSSQPPLISLNDSCAPEYENVRHYEEIPEYENLPFIETAGKALSFEWQNSSSVENSDTTVCVLEELYEDSDSQLNHGLQHLSFRASHEDHNSLDVVSSDFPSDEEEIIDSSDEDDASSDSSKGEVDLLDDKQGKGAGKKSKAHHIAKEIMSSEKVFVDVLKLLHIDFRDAVAHASRQLGKPVIEDRFLNQILYYLPQLYELNRDLLRELEERMLNWVEQQRIADIFVKKGPYLKMYSTYIKEFEKNVALLDEQCKKNPGFAAVVKDFEMSSRCASLALKHYLLKPVQRIPQYRLLLTDYLKNLIEESADYKDTQDALAVVIEVANHANDIMKQGDNFQKLMQIQYSLNGHHEIVQPGRVFLKEGTLMKLSRKVMQPRMFFLFNDALLYTTPVQSGMYKLNNMLSLAGMKVRKPTQEAYQNELKIESVERSFILSASSAVERDEWLEAISRSIEDYTKKRITFYPSKSIDETDTDKEEEVSPLGSKAPIWIPDTRVTMCMVCTSEFTLTWRRHHCRACGKIVCQACSSNKYGLDYLKNQPARVCERCFEQLQKQDRQHSPKPGSPANHKSTSSALSSVLQSIPSGRKQKKIPAALKEVSANTEDSSMSGYLYRSKGSKKPWKHLWFVIKNKVLYTYAASEDVAALESQPLLGFTVTEVKDENSESKVFHLLHKNILFYVFKADDPHSAQKWIEAFQEGTIL
ncbi:FYVE, RhoGEF and PH domain-containing protein 6 [Tachyglossus aculeatus]|uniref:FYVE, RhoGEF and PH domain-containing protein 6 n=1 Tax=Tachyglossus aculeatus TaxID=9261 RepID=UPI0018F2DBBC|nr:FYVE, RhoGEF and PH domain-containing protein 6 [Tachyglossus aculeatus]